MDQRANFLALILLDALEDENESDVFQILKRNSVNASYVPLERGIAPIHYVCGMDNQSLAIDIMKKFLACGADPNVCSEENMTPLHVAAIYGRVEIVKLLLEHGALLNVYDDNRKMPVHYAIDECHFDVVQIMRDHIFLQKYEKKKKELSIQKNSQVHSIMSETKLEKSFDNLISSNKNASTPLEKSNEPVPVNKHLQVPGHETKVDTPGGSKFTPNRVHYNYDRTSPYYINITHRRNKPQPLFPPLKDQNHNESLDEKSSSGSDESPTNSESVNLFALTKENLQELTQRLPSAERSRISMIETWREKVKQSRARQSILKLFDDPEQMVDQVMESDHLNFTNTVFKDKSSKSLKEQDVDSGACDSASVISLNENAEERPKTRLHGSMSLGQLIQKVARAQLINSEPSPPKNKKAPTPPPPTLIKNNEADADSSYQTVPEYPTETNKVPETSSTLTLVPDQNSSTNFIRSPKNNEYFLQMTEAYVHTDDENGLVFYETKLISNHNAKKTVKLQNLPECCSSDRLRRRTYLDTSSTSQSTDLTVPLDYETDALRAELTTFGEPPGPITKSTKRLYIKRLVKYKRNTASAQEIQSQLSVKEQKFSVELQRTLRSTETFEKIADYLVLESQSAEFFANLKQKKNLREGHLKQSFIYMLIDPRISANLSGESVYLEKLDIWKRFLDSIFYVGKGKTSRPYSHLYDAMKTHSRMHEKQNNADGDAAKKFPIRKQTLNADLFKSVPTQPSESKKLDRILNIWGNGSGVVCLHVFHNIVPTEAYTREAAIIDALGLKHLTNCKRGDYYGPAKTWTMKEKKYLGIALLYKAMQIYLAEGESQLSPSDLI